jgi:small subunit ribosomal protein S6
MYYKSAPAAISEIERRFRINEEILRFVTMKYDSKREIAAWNGMVEKTKKPAPTAAVAEKKEEVAS